MDHALGIATSLRGAGKALMGLKRWDEAWALLVESAQRYRDEDATSGYASALVLLAEAEAHRGDVARAARLARKSVDILRRLGPIGRLSIGQSGAWLLPRAEDLLDYLTGVKKNGIDKMKIPSVLNPQN